MAKTITDTWLKNIVSQARMGQWTQPTEEEFSLDAVVGQKRKFFSLAIVIRSFNRFYTFNTEMCILWNNFFNYQLNKIKSRGNELI